jgi:hypothetical protein
VSDETTNEIPSTAEMLSGLFPDTQPVNALAVRGMLLTLMERVAALEAKVQALAPKRK